MRLLAALFVLCLAISTKAEAVKKAEKRPSLWRRLRNTVTGSKRDDDSTQQHVHEMRLEYPVAAIPLSVPGNIYTGTELGKVAFDIQTVLSSVFTELDPTEINTLNRNCAMIGTGGFGQVVLPLDALPEWLLLRLSVLETPNVAQEQQ
ncbi:MAG: hypothetical protein MHM6MM_001393 [Cercozoa sp. M6MM]